MTLAINCAGGFGIGLGIGGAIATPLGNLAFGQGDSNTHIPQIFKRFKL